MEKRNIKLILEYDGSAYHGWQRQKKDLTIQEVLEEHIRIITNETVSVLGSGRTDAGVHALHQVCNFKTNSNIAPEPMRSGLNSLLPGDIFIKNLEDVSPDFHSRYSAKSKVYEYRIWNRKEPNIFLRDFIWHVRGKMLIDDMRRCLSMLVGEHDFSSFRSSGSSNRNPVRKMMRAELIEPEEGMFSFVFEAEGFLRHMVRNIVGTVITVGRGSISPEGFSEIFLAKDRCKAGINAPPHGLFLMNVKY